MHTNIVLGVLMGGIIATLIAILVPYSVAYELDAEQPEEPPIHKQVLIEVVKHVEVPEVLKNIADCESGKRTKDGKAIKGSATHYSSDGEVLLGRLNDPQYGVDIGKYQVNEYFHGKRAKELGLDLYNEQDNETYALTLYEESGTQPWSASQNCWSVVQ